MEYYFTDRKFNVMGVARTTGKGEWLVSADSEVKATDDRPSIALTLTIPFKTEQEQAIDEMAAENNFVLYQDEEGNGHQMVIASVTHDTLAHIHTVVCTDAGNDLMNEVVGAYAADKAYTIADYILRFTNDSGWEIGINEFPTDVRTLTWTDEDTALSRIKSVAKDFDAVLSFGFVFVGTTAVKRVINIRHEETSDSLISFEMNKDINNIVKTVDIYDMETSVKAYGATPDGSNDPINLIGYSWTDPTGQFVLDQYGFLHDAIAVQKYSRLLSNNNPNPTQSDWNRVKTFDSTTQATLLQAALADLKKYNHPNVNYEVDLANAPYVPLNQTVHIVDENQNLFLSAKVLSVERSRAGHPWLRYADDDQGTNMSAFPTGKKYMAIVWSNKSSVPSDNPADYAGKWALIKGADGANGKPGPKGADGTSSYLHTAYANSIDGKTDFSVTDASGRSYFGQYVDENQADSTDPTRYLWALFKGADGRDGKDGSDNVPVVTVGPSYPDKPKAGDQHWLTDEDGNVSAFAIFDTTNGWDTKPIAAAALNAETFNGMTFNGVTFNGSTFISSFKGFKPAGFANTVSGKTVIGDGTIVTDAKMDGNDKAAYHNETNQLGFISQYIYDGQVFSSFSAQGGSMVLSSTYAPHGTNVKLTSAFNASDAVYYQHIDSGLETNDVKNMRLGYSRQGPNVTIGIAFEMKTGNGWVRIADIRSGYKPFNNDDAARLLGSMSYTGAACQLYASAGGFYIIPWRGQGSYYGSVNFVTRDDYPIDDAVVI